MPFSAVSQFISQIDTAEGSGCALRYVAAQFLKDVIPQVEEKCLRGKAPMLATSGVFFRRVPDWSAGTAAYIT
jgi:hypothetical protein